MSYHNAHGSALLTEEIAWVFGPDGRLISPAPLTGRPYQPPETAITLADGSTLSLPSSGAVLTDRGYVLVSDLTKTLPLLRFVYRAPDISGKAPTASGLSDLITFSWYFTAKISSTALSSSLVRPTGSLIGLPLVFVPETSLPTGFKNFCGCAIPDTVAPCSGQQTVKLPTPAVT